MPTISGQLKGTNYGDNERLDVRAGDYGYTVSATGDGKLSFKVEAKNEHDNWETVEQKSKIRGGTTLDGSFTVPAQSLDAGEVRFNFNREFLSSEVGYRLDYEPTG